MGRTGVSLSGFPLLDWALLALSFFNMFLQLWLGLTVLLNAERRSPGVWLMGGGLLTGAAFFISHTAILGSEINAVTGEALNLWWQIGWVPVIVAPFAWYVVVLWYAGYWNAKTSRLKRRHRPWLVGLSLLGVAMVLLTLIPNPLPTYDQIIQLDLSGVVGVNGVPLLFALFPAFMVLCIVLSIDALRRPESPERLMGELARRRSRPWLLATSVVLLIVGLLVSAFIAEVVSNAQAGFFIDLSFPRIALFDMILAGLIALATALLGRAVVAYEVFTGQTLPRRGFARQWRNAILLAAGYSTLIGWGLAAQIRPIYSLLLTTLLLVIFFALYNWRSFVEREQFMARLRPFVSSQHLLQQLVGADDAVSSANLLFEAVCRDVLDAAEAHLIPSGGLATLAGPPLVYGGNGRAAYPTDLDNATQQIVALDPAQHGGLEWAIPLWAARGRIGTLLLGAKGSGGLYTREEIEIARAGGERIIDMLAGEQMARRLMALQRSRLTESRVMDRRTRRALHDETLPTLHTALLHLSSLPREEPAVRDAIAALTAVHRQVADLIHTIGGVPAPLNGQSDFGDALRRTIQDEFAGEFNSVTWAIPDDLPAIDPLQQEVLLGAAREAVRNAAVHGRGGKAERPLHLRVMVTHEHHGLCLTIEDDGVGLGAAKTSTAIPAGSGGGLILHSTMLALLGGTLTVAAEGAAGTRVVISLALEELQ